ncbi:transcription factor WhiB [Streptomyces sp. NPDC059597]|uniref:transcription factor WhiB n=1 Tax=Streptomyces sp. NPDC059597 TaxID=3346879 RepID=UPI0036C441DD
MNGWIGGLQVRGLDRGQTPTADFLCTACGTYRRITGRAAVGDFVRANPMAEHRVVCRPLPKTT